MIEERVQYRRRIDALLDELSVVRGKLNETLIRAEMAEEAASYAQLELIKINEERA